MKKMKYYMNLLYLIYKIFLYVYTIYNQKKLNNLLRRQHDHLSDQNNYVWQKKSSKTKFAKRKSMKTFKYQRRTSNV